MVETDGPYGGYACSSTNHSHHEDVTDSIYSQLKLQSHMYRVLRDREVYINQPDDYFYHGGSKTGMVYDTLVNNNLNLNTKGWTFSVKDLTLKG